MKSGYDSLIWVNDKKGREYVCTITDNQGRPKSFEQLTDKEKKHCTNVNYIVGTERW